MAGLPGLPVMPHALLAQPQQLIRPPSVGHAAAASQQARAAEAAANAKKLAGKKRKAQEKAAGEKALHLIPESALFNSLVMLEHELDKQIKNRKADIQAAATPFDHPVHKRLRIYIYSTHSNQPSATAAASPAAAHRASSEQDAAQQQQQQAQANTPGSSSSQGQEHVGQPPAEADGLQEPPQWTLCIWGRLVDPTDPLPPPGSIATAASAGMAAAAPASAAQQQQGQSSKHHPFTSFFKRIEVQLDSEQYQDDMGLFVWEKFHHRGPHKDKIEIKRPGSMNSSVQITLEQDFMPAAYKLAPELSELLDVSIGQQTSIMARIWTHIHQQKPQGDPRVLHLDDKLSGILGVQQPARDDLAVAVGKLLQPIAPVNLQYNIELTGPSPGPVMCVDVDVLLPTKPQDNKVVQDKILQAVDALLDDKQLEAVGQKQTVQLQKLFEARRRRAMFLGFAEAPVTFINTVIAGHARELRVSRAGIVEVERKTDLFNEKWLEEATASWLGKRNNLPLR